LSRVSDEDPVISLAERRAQAQAAAAEAAREQARQQTRRDGSPAPHPWVTWTLIGLNAAVWLVMVGLGVDVTEPSVETLVAWGGNAGFMTTGGQWWRLLTAMFLHSGIIHLAFNLYFAWVIGRICEQVFGPAAYALVYFGSGLFASLVSVAWQPVSVSVGASGALFGVFGAFLGFTIRRRDMLPPEFVKSVRRNALILIGLNLAIGFAVPGIDVAAHVGGLVAGLGIGYAIARLAEKPVSSRQQANAVRIRAIGLTGAATAAILLASALGLWRWHQPVRVLERVDAERVEVLERYRTAPSVEIQIGMLVREVIPMLHQCEAELRSLERVPAPYHEIADILARYCDLQAQAFEHELMGLRTGSENAKAEAESLHAEAHELLR
jgi:rhomboid protease GluP